MQMFQRGEIRERLRLNGNGCSDCLVSWCCACCALVQEEREVQDFQQGKGVYATVAPQQPSMQPGMSYSTPPFIMQQQATPPQSAPAM